MFLTGCTLGYRRNQYNTTVTRDTGPSLEVKGHADNVEVMLTADFRYFRLGVPFEGGRTVLKFEADNGSTDRSETVRERRFFRLDAPILSVFQAEQGWGLWYPGVLEKRSSLELWVNVEADFLQRGHRWADLGVMWYRYNSVGFKIYGGIGSEAFRASTTADEGFVRVWDNRALNWGVGVEITVTAGEYFLQFLKFLGKVDDRHQKRIKRRGY